MSFSPNDQAKINAVTDKLLDVHVRWLREFAESLDRGYDEFMSELADCIENGYAMNVGSNDTDVPSDLWTHYEAVRGPVPKEKRDSFWFSCAC